MRLIARAAGGLLAGSIAAMLVILLLANVLVPSLSQYINDTFPVEKNAEYVSVFADDPDPDHALPSNGDTYETDDYYYIYDSSLEGWRVNVKDKSKTEYSPLNTEIYGRAVMSLAETFKGCTAMKQSPAIPSGVIDMTSAFYGCTSLTGILAIHANPIYVSNCFAGTVRALSLIGDSECLSKLSSTSTAGNIVIK